MIKEDVHTVQDYAKCRLNELKKDREFHKKNSKNLIDLGISPLMRNNKICDDYEKMILELILIMTTEVEEWKKN